MARRAGLRKTNLRVVGRQFGALMWFERRVQQSCHKRLPLWTDRGICPKTWPLSRGIRQIRRFNWSALRNFQTFRCRRDWKCLTSAYSLIKCHAVKSVKLANHFLLANRSKNCLQHMGSFLPRVVAAWGCIVNSKQLNSSTAQQLNHHRLLLISKIGFEIWFRIYVSRSHLSMLCVVGDFDDCRLQWCS